MIVKHIKKKFAIYASSAMYECLFGSMTRSSEKDLDQITPVIGEDFDTVS